MVKYWQEDVKDIYSKLDTSEKGLASVDADKRLNEDGFNELKTEVRISKLRIFIEQFQDFITYILIFAGVVSCLSGFFHDAEHYVDAIIIFSILIINAVIGFFQEYSAQKSLEALKKMNKVKAKVYRNNKLVEINSKYLVKGDVIFLEAGDKVPADCRIFEERKLKVEESALTGESVPVEKHSSIIDDEVQIGDQKNMLFSGTSLAEGTARAIVVHTGMKTEIGKITQLITDAEEEMTPLQKRLDKFGRQLGIAVIGVCLFVFFYFNIKRRIQY